MIATKVHHQLRAYLSNHVMLDMVKLYPPLTDSGGGIYHDPRKDGRTLAVR